MKITNEWQGLLDVAEADRCAMELLLTSDIPLAIACFHGQQAIEKYIKTALRRHGVAYPFVHDLEELRLLVLDQGITIPLTVEQAVNLNPFAVSQRYDLPPEYEITREELKETVDLMAKWCQEQLL